MTAAPLATLGPSRAQLERFEELLRGGPRAEIETINTFGPGFYARTIRMKAGTVLTGKVHATEHVFFVSEGDITIVTEEGSQRVGAGYQKVCRPGLKRAGYCHADTTCTNVHVTTETDLAKLEAALIQTEGLTGPGAMPCLG